MDVSYVSVIEDNIYLVWQQELQIFNFIELGIAQQLWVVVLYQGASPDAQVLQPLLALHGNRVRIYKNSQPGHVVQGYKAMNKPWGISRLLQEEPALGRFLFSIDSDVWLKRPIDFTKMQQDERWYGSSCSSYLDANHWQLGKHFTDEELDRVTRIAGVSAAEYKMMNDRAIGAQLLFKDVSWPFFAAVAEDAWRIHDALKEIHEGGKENQHWVGEMLSFMLHILRVKGPDGVASSAELDFAWATTQDEAEFERHHMVHMAGAFERDGPYFCKERYTLVKPWACKKGFSYVTAAGASASYIDLMQRYVASPRFGGHFSKQT